MTEVMITSIIEYSLQVIVPIRALKKNGFSVLTTNLAVYTEVRICIILMLKKKSQIFKWLIV